jgi:hypothetical protein
LLDDFLNKRKEIISFLGETADEHHNNIEITKVITVSTEIVGTILVLTGVALAIPTGGISIALAVVGGALAATSVAAHLGSDIAKHILTKWHLEKLDELCQVDEQNIFKLADYLEEIIRNIQEHPSENKAKRKTACSILEGISGVSNLTCSILRVTQATFLSVKTVRLII